MNTNNTLAIKHSENQPIEMVEKCLRGVHKTRHLVNFVPSPSIPISISCKLLQRGLLDELHYPNCQPRYICIVGLSSVLGDLINHPIARLLEYEWG